MPNDEGNERDEGRNHEEWQARDPGCLPGVWYEDVQNWQELKLLLSIIEEPGFIPGPLFVSGLTI